MKVLITGGGGFVGSHLADRLLDEGHEVLVIDNFSTGRRDNLSERDGLTLVEDTIADAGAVDRAFADFGPTHVVHAAASYKDPEAWVEDVATNAIGTANVVKATRAAGLDRLIYFQTALCYGTQPSEQPVTLNHPVRPDSSYAISKTACEQYIEMGLPNFVSFRLANAYGPRNISGPLPTFFQRLTAGKPCFVMDTRRDFIYIDDLVDVVMLALEGKGQGKYHVSSGADFSIKELFDATIKALDIELEEDVEVRPRGEDDAFTILLDPSRTNADFGWKITTPLEDGVAKAIAYYRERGIEETYTHLKVPTK
jgi:UDP-glucose 4-epimerase